MKKEKWKTFVTDRWKVAAPGLLAAFAVCFIFFIYAPLELYVTNQTEFWFDFYKILKAVLQNFGSSLYSNVGRSAPKMMTVLQLAYKNASIPENKALLLAAGFTQADIDAINSTESALNTAYNVQQDYIQQTYLRTEERISAFNAVWDELVLISGASKFIFTDSPAKRRFYLLYPSKKDS